MWIDNGEQSMWGLENIHPRLGPNVGNVEGGPCWNWSPIWGSPSEAAPGAWRLGIEARYPELLNPL